MRRPRDYDAELKALDDRARALRQRKVMQLGELVMACKADALPPEELAGALLVAARNSDAATREQWRKAGEALFASGRSARRARRNRAGAAQVDGAAQSSAGKAGAP